MRAFPILCASLLLASGALAQTGPTETVTVIGRKLTDREMVNTIIPQFVALHAARSSKSGLVARAAPAGICPAVLGLPDAFDTFIAARIASVAKTLGSPVQEAGKCIANVQVLFTDDPQGVVTDLSNKTNGAILGIYFTHGKGSIIHVQRPIQAWHVTGTKRDMSGQGRMVVGEDSTLPGKVTVDTAYGPTPWTGTGSRIQVRNSGQIVNVLIVADLNKVAGQEIGPIADYVAMLALSQPQSFDGCNALPSILDLMSSGCSEREKPKALTESDLAYLKALYTADIATSGYTAQENIANSMATNLGAATP